ncbi:hypothetical protein Leryth_019182, partial [Lithospermum erythrorhizon]
MRQKMLPCTMKFQLYFEGFSQSHIPEFFSSFRFVYVKTGSWFHFATLYICVDKNLANCSCVPPTCYCLACSYLPVTYSGLPKEILQIQIPSLISCKI